MVERPFGEPSADKPDEEAVEDDEPVGDDQAEAEDAETCEDGAPKPADSKVDE